ncbi:MAG: ribosome maturation factor RimM [Syntrophobacteraceae bacterium]
MDNSSLVPIAKVGKTHGVRGAVKVHPYGETLGELEAGEKLLAVSSDGKAKQELTLAGARPHQRAWICEFDEINDMGQGQALAGSALFVPRDRLPLLPEGEYYHFQLIGLEVVTRDGRNLGILQAILETGSNDVYVVDCDGRELLLPAIEDVVCEIDLPNRKIVVAPPEGIE